MKQKLLVDTSVFIDFFRGESYSKLEVLIREDRVILSQIVLLEIIKGVTNSESKKVFSLLNGLDVLPDFPPAATCQDLLLTAKRLGLQGGLPDLLILADCYVNQVRLYSIDLKLIKLAKALKISVLAI